MNFFPINYLSSESVAFQIDIKFVENLKHIFQQALDFPVRYNELHGVPTDEKTKVEKASKFQQFLNKEIGPKIKSIISHYLKTDNFKILFPISYDLTELFNMGVVYSIYKEKKENNTDTESMSIKKLIIKGNASDTQVSNDQIYELINHIADGLDKDTITFNKDKMKDLHFTIILPAFCFCINDMIDIPNELQPTAEELVATFFHEIGHVVTMVEYIQYGKYIGLYGNNITAFYKDKQTINTNDIKYYINFLKAQRQVVVSQLESRKTNPKVVNLVASTGKVLDIIDRYCNMTLKDDEVIKSLDLPPGLITTLFIGDFISGLFMSVIKILLLPAYVLTRPLVFSADFYRDKKLIEHSNSDEYVTNRNTSVAERLADEMVAKLGLSRALNSWLIKSAKFTNIIKDRHVLIGSFKYDYETRLGIVFFSTINFYSHLSAYFYRLLVWDNNKEYENTFNRMSRNIANMYDNLNNRDIPLEVRKELVNEVDMMRDEYRTFATQNQFGLFDKIVKSLIELGSKTVESGVNIFTKNNLMVEYENLFNALDRIQSHELGYHATKIQSLIRE